MFILVEPIWLKSFYDMIFTSNIGYDIIGQLKLEIHRVFMVWLLPFRY